MTSIDESLPSDSPLRLHLLVKGLVQGVWFRQSTLEQAGQLGLMGWVRNLPDGRVEILAEGRKAALEVLLRWSNEGPPLARVDHVDVHWEIATRDFKNFRVR